MLCYEEIYGDDADGNRGVMQYVVEIEDSDADDIIEALYEDFIDGAKAGAKTIRLYCAKAGEDVDVEVDIEDYITELIARADADEDIKGDADLQEWLKGLKQEIKGKAITVVNHGNVFGNNNWYTFYCPHCKEQLQVKEKCKCNKKINWELEDGK